MRKLAQVFVASSLVAFKVSADELDASGSTSDPKHYELGIQCTAIFAIFAELYSEKGNTAESASYRNKLHSLYNAEEQKFLVDGRSKDEFESYIQRHIDGLAQIAPTHPNAIIALKDMCDEKFP